MPEKIHYPKIFISYRRNDTRGLVETLHKQLSTFYANEVFIDKDNIAAGAFFAEVIEQNIKHCDLFLPVFGPNWDNPNFIQRLKKSKDLVREEMKWAIKYNKYIIPILIDREAVPDDTEIPVLIKEQILQRNGIILRGNTELWLNEIRTRAELIEKKTGLKPKKKSIKSSEEKHCFEQIYYLDRIAEYGKIKYGLKNGQFMFAANGSKNAGFMSFTQRCSRDVLAGAKIKTITWKQFEKMPDSMARSNELLDMIVEQLPIKERELSAAEKIENIQKHFRGNKYIFSCTRLSAGSNNHNQGVLKEWWDTWSKLINNNINQNVIVVLFTVPGWKFRLNLLGRFPKKTRPDNMGTFGGVNKDDVLAWKEKYIEPTNLTLSDKHISQLFFMCRSKNFQHIEQRLLESITTTQLSNSDD